MSWKIKAQLMAGDEIALGPGKADLLDAIAATGSISAAGRAMGLSYRRAWLMVDAMNRLFAEPLVLTVRGGPGGASLSDFGRAVLGDYRALQARLEKASGGLCAGIAGRLKG
ncbi:winged helix-turn-helix domain-containing protein [Polymorphobacter sp.]|uniref:winged helix-turn-helix domain-containing protein n=1 Tax=Polymorphobacter sp. TaxID=1909290 RepID=UPI003F6FBEA0